MYFETKPNTEKQLHTIPQLVLNGISQVDFENAFKTLQICTKPPLPHLGFPYAFVAPGGDYGNCWWQLDSTLALCGYKWYQLDFTKQALRNFISAQREDGRIPLYGFDQVQNYEPNSSLPKLFIVSYEVICHSGDISLAKELYPMLKKYLNWWLSHRKNNETGLISAVFEETFVPYLHRSDEYLPVDTNIEIAVGCSVVSSLAKLLEYKDDEKKYQEIGNQLKIAINNYLWNEEKGAYFAYLVKEQRHDDFLQSTTFQALRLQTAPKKNAEKLISLLQTEEWGWNTYPVTTASKNDSHFVATEGKYKFNASWSGNVWTLRNVDVIQALNDYQFYAISASLIWKTIKEFNHNYWEFLHADNGCGNGENDYAWTASQYIQLIIEELFGIHVDAFNNTVSIIPCLSKEFVGKTISLSNLTLFDGSMLSVVIDNTDEPKIIWNLSEFSKVKIQSDQSRIFSESVYLKQ